MRGNVMRDSANHENLLLAIRRVEGAIRERTEEAARRPSDMVRLVDRLETENKALRAALDRVPPVACGSHSNGSCYAHPGHYPPCTRICVDWLPANDTQGRKALGGK